MSRLGGTRQRVVFHLLPLVQAETRTSVPAANAVEVNFKSLRLKMFLGVLGLNSFTDMNIYHISLLLTLSEDQTSAENMASASETFHLSS